MNDIEYKLKVMVVEDEEKILASIVRKIGNVAKDCEIVATARNGREALDLVEKLRPNIIFTDIKMPLMDGLALSMEIKSHYTGIEVVIISGHADFSFAQEAISYGVFSYLLKPVDDTKLRDVIDDIRSRFEEATIKKLRSITMPQIMTAQDQLINQMPDESPFMLVLFCFDNLCYDNTDEVLEHYYNEKLSEINWGNLMSEIPYQSGLWMVTDESPINQRMLMIAIRDGECLDVQMTVQTLCNSMTQIYGFKCINVCCHIKHIRKSEMWVYSKRMRNILKTSVVLTKPAVYTVEQDERVEEDRITDVIKHRLDAVVKSFFKGLDYDRFSNDLKNFFVYLYQNNMSQKHFEKMIVHVLHAFESNVDNYDALLSEQLQSDLFRTLCQASQYEEIEAPIFRCINNFLHRPSDGAKIKMQTELLDYVDQNYLTIDKIEEVAEAFHYNTTYLSRMFKKMTGTTLIKYITIKRMDYAKKIIETCSDIMMSRVGEMVGYHDQHYFSRIFKLVVGETPSEYKMNVNRR